VLLFKKKSINTTVSTLYNSCRNKDLS